MLVVTRSVLQTNLVWLLNVQNGSEIDLSVEPDNEFPFAKIFHVDAKADGTDAGNDSDDVNSDTLFGGCNKLSSVIVTISFKWRKIT